MDKRYVCTACGRVWDAPCDSLICPNCMGELRELRKIGPSRKGFRQAGQYRVVEYTTALRRCSEGLRGDLSD